MDAALLLAGILVLAFDAYAYRIYVAGRESLDAVYSSTRRALQVKDYFDADQEPQGAADEAFIARKQAALPAKPFEINVPFRRVLARAPEATQAFPARAAAGRTGEAEIAFLRGELESLKNRFVLLERASPAPAGAEGGGRGGFSAADLDAKQAELHRLFMKRQVSDDTYRAVCAEIAKIRLGL